MRMMTRGALLVAGSAAALLAVAAPALAAGGQLYCGAGRGRTADSAVQAAIDDGDSEGYNDGRYHCTLVGDPHIDEVFNDPTFGHVFFASVTVSCE